MGTTPPNTTPKTTVCLDEFLSVQCEGFLNGGETWNGWEQPIFNADQLATIRAWWDSENMEQETDYTWDEQVTEIGNNEFVLFGWTWQIDNNTH